MNAQMYGSWIQENGKPIRNSTAAIVTTNRANRALAVPSRHGGHKDGFVG
jgi:hypothetical protein